MFESTLFKIWPWSQGEPTGRLLHRSIIHIVKYIKWQLHNRNVIFINHNANNTRLLLRNKSNMALGSKHYHFIWINQSSLYFRHLRANEGCSSCAKLIKLSNKVIFASGHIIFRFQILSFDAKTNNFVRLRFNQLPSDSGNR